MQFVDVTIISQLIRGEVSCELFREHLYNLFSPDLYSYLHLIQIELFQLRFEE